MSSKVVAKVSLSDLQGPDVPPVASITDVKYLSSYNWIESPKPTIAVPGSPPLWAAPKLPQRVNKDSGLIYIAQNAARHPDSPLEPLFRAIYVTDPSFDIRPIDIVTDRNNIRKLLSFVDPTVARNGLEEFTINIEVTKNTAIFSRDETETQDIIGPNEFKGFGHEFEKACTINKIVGSTGHHRIISYRFGGLNVIVRHETDGYVGATAGPSSSARKAQSPSDLTSVFDSLSLSPTNTNLGTTTKGSKLIVQRDGQAVPLSSTLEIKTRVSHKPLEIREVAAQIWVSQTPKLVRAYHQRGVFKVPTVEDITPQIKKWEQDKQVHLRKLALLMRRIVNVVKNCRESVTLRYDRRENKLILTEVPRKKMLPQDLYLKWDDASYTRTAAGAGVKQEVKA
ncbi:uncharacterized protein F4812DRAFT_42053 [Daldinia caldariorum]|uniref:uncharacterized protein n=1 Tax=Daldinia caldariorum TaxID=326644 RepID=UPI002008D490|nr:uncharacterized protein F4812DRAFT_42053 [Daldinia caldariorum]KAI1473183.1 hypothetical protein F4812DRAFT_42053 [Daldinia caldariorum]